MRYRMAMLVGILALGGCGGGEHEGRESDSAEPVRTAAVAPPPAPVDSAPASAPVREDSVRAAFRAAGGLGAREISELRRDVNAEQIAIARTLGVRASGAAEITRLVKAGRLVALGDSTPYWVLRKMEHSAPYVTPDARAMLVRLGRRFHARLDSLGLPRYRMKVTSALRTDESQTALRRINANASRTVSAHEFGTTVDVSHERFAVPAGAGAATAMLEAVGKENSRPLQAELGRALAELRDSGALRVMMEDAQPVYHFTVARRTAE